MPSGVYTRTKEQIKKTQISRSWYKHHSKETIEKMIQSKLGSNNPNWEGGRYKDNHGYIFIYKPNHPFCNSRGYVREHRLVVEKEIGRYLLPKEKVHHLGEKDDNRPQMLMAFINIGYHKKFHKNISPVKPSEIIFDGHRLP